MSFFLDPPALFIIGLALYFAGKKWKLERLTKITIGLIIVLSFIIFSLLLYADVFRCVFPAICSSTSGSEFMFYPNIFGFYKKDFPPLAVFFIFFLGYPLSIYFGYALPLGLSKELSKKYRKVSKEVKTYGDVKSQKQIKKDPKVSVKRYPDTQHNINDLQQAVRKAVGDLDGMQSYVQPGWRVLIKVNICGGIPDNPATYTSKEVVGYVVDMVREAKAHLPIIICDADMIWTKFSESAKVEDWMEWAAARKGVVELVNLSEKDLVLFDFGEQSVLKKEFVSKYLLDAHVIISIPKMKTHLLTNVTLGMKNMYGTLPEMDKAKYHKAKFNQKELMINEVIYLINKAFTPTLTIIDGSIGGEAIGPLSCERIDDFNTIIASNNVVVADALASRLMGYDDPLKIDHIRIAQERDLGDVKLAHKFDLSTLPKHKKDKKWKRPDIAAVESYENLIENLLMIPTWVLFFNIGADFLLFDAARIPYLKSFNKALLQFLYEVKRNNLIIFSLLALFALYGFVTGGYLANSTFYFALGFILTLILGMWFAGRMKTKHLVAITITSFIVAAFVERFPVLAGMWSYLENAAPPLFALFAVPIFIITIIGFSNILKRVFEYVGLKGEKFRYAPFVLIALAFYTFMLFEGYLAKATTPVIMMYTAMAILSVYYTEKQTLDWNLALAIVAVAMGGAMELLGAFSGLWSYPFGERLPVFISFAWALNTWAACGLAQIFGINLREAFAD